MTYEYLQHMTTGEIFAVEMDEQQNVVASVGPIPRRELPRDPSECVQNMTADDNEWFTEQDAAAGEAGAFRLVEGAELAQIIGRESEE